MANRIILPFMCTFLISVGMANGQSLADVATKTAAQLEAAKTKGTTPTKVYTEKDLKKDAAPPPVVSSAPDAAPPAVATSAAPTTPAPIDYAKIAKHDEAYWKTARRDAQALLDADAIHLAAMQQRVVSLGTDFDATLSVTQRAVLRREYEATRTEAARLRAAVVTDRLAITRLEEEARRAGVPPGWLRP